MLSEAVIFRLAALTLTLNGLILVCWLAGGYLTRLRLARPASYVLVLPRAAPAPTPVPEAAAPPRYADPLPAAWRLPIQPGGPDDVVIHIGPKEPPSWPGIEQRPAPLKSLT